MSTDKLKGLAAAANDALAAWHQRFAAGGDPMDDQELSAALEAFRNEATPWNILCLIQELERLRAAANP